MGDRNVDSFQAEFCAKRLKALADAFRLRIVDSLRHGEMTVGDIAQLLETEAVRVSHHLQILKRVDIVADRRDGKYIYYRLHDDLLKAAGDSKNRLDLGCCSIEVPPDE